MKMNIQQILILIAFIYKQQFVSGLWAGGYNILEDHTCDKAGAVALWGAGSHSAVTCLEGCLEESDKPENRGRTVCCTAQMYERPDGHTRVRYCAVKDT